LPLAMFLKRLSLPAPGLVMEPKMLLSWGVGAEKTVAESAQMVNVMKLVERMMAVDGEVKLAKLGTESRR
jgi:hypothetical protein